MIYKTLGLISLLFLSGCTSMGLNSDAIGVVTTEYGQCLHNMEEAPRFKKKKVTFRCENDRVLLGTAYERKGKWYIDSGILVNQGGKFKLKDKKRAGFKHGIGSVCQLEPMQGKGTKEIKRYYFDLSIKKCRPFIWHGDGGFVPFKSIDACQQFCNYKYQG